MKKIFLVIGILILLSIGSYYLSNVKEKMPKNLINQTKKENVITSIKDALTKSMSMKCVYKNEKGTESTTYIKNGLIRVIMMNSENTDDSNNILIRDKKMYMWSDKTKKGYILAVNEPKTTPTKQDLNEIKELQKKYKEQPNNNSLMDEIEKYKDACKVTNISDSLFTIPTDISFQDMEQMQKQMMENLPKAPQGESQENIQKYIQETMQQQETDQ